jgi:hypothetical protein
VLGWIGINNSHGEERRDTTCSKLKDCSSPNIGMGG